MVKVVANGYKISYERFVIEIDTSVSTVNVYKRQRALADPLKLIKVIETDNSPIDCLLRAMDFIYEYKQGNHTTM